MARRAFAKSPAMREEIERLTRAYLDAGHEMHRYDKRKRIIEDEQDEQDRHRRTTAQVRPGLDR
jgi:hypothetical protein